MCVKYWDTYSGCTLENCRTEFIGEGGNVVTEELLLLLLVERKLSAWIEVLHAVFLSHC